MSRESHIVISSLLSGYRFSVGREIHLQDGIEKVLRDKGVKYLREHRLGRGPIDFYLPDDGLGIEAKTDGSQSDVWRQLVDYAGDAQISGLVLVTSKPSHLEGIRNEICGKPFAIVRAWRGL